MPTIHDVAREAGVSARTVSRVLNDAANVHPDTRAAVLAVAERMDFRPDPYARALKSGRKRVVGIVANSVSSDATQRRIEVIAKLFGAAGYAAMVQYADSAAAEEAAVRHLAPRCDGLAVFSNLPAASAPYLDALAADAYPFLLIDPPLAVPYPSVLVDRRGGYREAVKYLARRGRRRILLLIEEFRSGERLAGYRDGLDAVGLAFDSDDVLRTGKGFAGGSAAAPAVAGRFRAVGADAVLCHNDKIALGLLAGLRPTGLSVPADLAVIGFDDDGFAAYVEPPLTTIAQGGGDIGAGIFQQLRDTIEDGTPAETRSFPTGLIIRGSA
jgi:LacI family transcriptional regulator